MTLKDELIAAIQNEENHFHMNYFIKPKTVEIIPESCKTASCMAGHIVALRKEVAKKLMPEYIDPQYGGLHYDDLAARIWEDEMDEECTLDFYGENCDTPLDDITRQQTVDHINDTGNWHRLDDSVPDSY